MRIQSGTGFIEEEDLGIPNQCCGQRQPLLLATGEAPHTGAAELANAKSVHEGIDVHGVTVHAGNMTQEGDWAGRRREAAILKHDTYAGPQVSAGGVRIRTQE
jgi:hypothetical protein